MNKQKNNACKVKALRDFLRIVSSPQSRAIVRRGKLHVLPHK
jgi:hypothetical protein